MSGFKHTGNQKNIYASVKRHLSICYICCGMIPCHVMRFEDWFLKQGKCDLVLDIFENKFWKFNPYFIKRRTI